MTRINVIDLLLSLLILSLVLTGCFGTEVIPNPQAQNPSPVSPVAEQASGSKLRIKNAGSVDIENLTVLFPDSRITFGTVPAGATTDFLAAPKGVYNYAAYEFTYNGEAITQPVIDWVGESPRSGSTFTYVISMDQSQPKLRMIQLIEVQNQ